MGHWRFLVVVIWLQERVLWSGVGLRIRRKSANRRISTIRRISEYYEHCYGWNSATNRRNPATAFCWRSSAAVAKICRGRNLTITCVTRYKMANWLDYNIDFYERLFRRERVSRPDDAVRYLRRAANDRAVPLQQGPPDDDLCGARSAIGIQCRKAWRHSAHHSVAGHPAYFSVRRVSVGCGRSVWPCQMYHRPPFSPCCGCAGGKALAICQVDWVRLRRHDYIYIYESHD